MSTRNYGALEAAIAAFAEERGWAQFHDPKNLSMALASEAGELAAVLRWVGNAESDASASNPSTRSKLLDEMGDVGILLIALCNRLGVHLDDVVRAKLAVNAENYPANRSHGHPGR